MKSKAIETANAITASLGSSALISSLQSSRHHGEFDERRMFGKTAQGKTGSSAQVAASEVNGNA